MLQDWNAPASVAVAQAVHHRFEAQARQHPERQALALDDQTLSYGELNRQANRLAHYLIDQGSARTCLVGVGSGAFASPWWSACWRCLKAGGAYVPLDPQYPRERLLHMLEDSHVRLVVCQSALAIAVARRGGDWLDIDSAKDALQRCAESNPQVPVAPQNLAYVIYTSGSTGKPKGVAINHAALTEFSAIAAGYSRLSQDDRVLQFATLNFDGFVEQLYPALTHGATVVLRGAELWTAAACTRKSSAKASPWRTCRRRTGTCSCSIAWRRGRVLMGRCARSISAAKRCRWTARRSGSRLALATYVC